MLLRSLRTLLVLCSTLALVVFAIVAAGTLARPAALDSVEVAALERATRFAEGGPLYLETARPDEPALMPGFPVAVSALVRAFGPDLRQPRALTVLAALALAALVLLIVRLEAESWTLATAGAGCMLLGYGLLPEPPGAARPETLVVLFALAGFAVLRLTNGVAGAIAAAVPLAAAHFTGPPGAWLVAGALVALALDRRARLLGFALAAAALVGGGHVLLSRAFGPWFNFEAWDAPLRALRPDPAAALHYVGGLLLGRFGVLTLAMLLAFAMPTPPWRGKGGLWTCFALAAIAAGLASTQSAHAGPGALVAVVVAAALAGPISMQRVTRHLSAWPGSTRLGGHTVVLAALLLQFVVFLSAVTASGWLAPDAARGRVWTLRTPPAPAPSAGDAGPLAGGGA